MTLQQLLDLGLEEEVAKKVKKEFDDSINGNYIPKHRFDEVNEELKSEKKKVSDRDKEINNLSKSTANAEEYKKQLEDLQTTLKEKDKASKAELDLVKKESAMKVALANEVHDFEVAKGLINTDALVFNDKGELQGLEEQVKTLKKEKAFLFKETKQDDGSGGKVNPLIKVLGEEGLQNKQSSASPDSKLDAKKIAQSVLGTGSGDNKAIENAKNAYFSENK